MPPALVQAAVSNGASATTTVTVTLGAPATAGSLIVAPCQFRADHTMTTPAGFTLAKTQNAGSADTTHSNAAIYYKVAAGGEQAVVFTIAAGNGNLNCALLEWSPGAGQIWVTPLDQINGHDNGSGGTSDTCGVITTHQPNEVIVVAHAMTGTTNPTARSWGGGFAEAIFNQVSGTSSLSVGTRIVSATLTTAATTSWTGAQLGDADAIASFFTTASGGSAPVNTVAPAVTGTATVGQVLSTTNGTWTDDGSPTFIYQWQRAGVNIGGATSSTYTLVDADDGSAIRCVVTDNTPDGNTPANSNATAAVIEPAPTNSVVPALGGNNAQVGQAITVTTGTWANMAGAGGSSFTYQWRDCATSGGAYSDIVGATGSSYTVGGGEVGLFLKCVVTAHNTNGSPGTATTVASNQVAAGSGATFNPAVHGGHFSKGGAAWQ